MSGRVRRVKAATAGFAVLGLLILGAIAAGLVSSVPAEAATWSGRSWLSGNFWRGHQKSQTYFDRRNDILPMWDVAGGQDRSPVLPRVDAGGVNLSNSGRSIPNYVNTVDEFIDYLQGRYNASAVDRTTTQRWYRAGVPFIIGSILGKSGDQITRNITSADFEEARARMKAASINWSVTLSSGGSAAWGGYTNSSGGTSGVADIYRVNEDDAKEGILMRSSNGAEFRIFRDCANPVGDSSGLAPVWSIRAESYVKKVTSDAPQSTHDGYVQTNISVSPGDVVSFKHDMRAQSGNIAQAVNYTVRGTGFPASFYPTSGSTSLVSGSVAPTIANNVLFVNIGAHSGGTNGDKTVRRVTQDDVGHSLCQAIEYQPSTATNARETRTLERCADVPYRYTLVPSVHNVPAAVEPSRSISAAVTGGVSNGAAGATKSYQTNAVYTRIIHKTSQSNPNNEAGGTSTSEPCAYFGVTSTARCTTSSAGSDNTVFQPGTTMVPALSDVIPADLEPGDRVCYALSVYGYNEVTGPSKDGYSHSALSCTVVGKKPKVHVNGGDLRVGAGSTTSSNVTTSVTNLEGAVLPAAEAELDAQVKNTRRYWYFGKGAGLYFGDSGTTTTAKTLDMTGGEGTTVITNGQGVVQFFTDGMNVYSRTGAILPNGNSLGGNSSTTQAAAAFPIADNKYIIIVSTAQTEGGIVGTLRYSIVDMSIGAGRVTLKNQQFGSNTDNSVGEALSVTPNSTNNGYWVVTNTPGTNRVKAYPVPYTWNGANATAINPVVSTGGTASGASSGRHAPGFGSINFNESATEAVLAMHNENTNRGNVRVLSFNNATGRFTERLSWLTSSGDLYAADFSPSGEYLYVSSLYVGGAGAYLQRYNIKQGNSVSAVLSSRHDIATGSSMITPCGSASGGGGHVKRAPDGKMYVARNGCTTIGVVNNPDASNSGIGWSLTGRSLPSGSTSSFGLPQVSAVLRINTDPPKHGSREYGSWSEYAITASGQVRGMASAAGYAGGRTTDGGAIIPSYCALSLLTFSNRPTTGACLDTSMGRYALPERVQTVADMYEGQPKQTIGALVRPSALTVNGIYQPSVSGQITIEQSTLPAGRSIIIYAPNNDILIGGSQRYAETIASVEQIPQLVIIGRNITIHESATEVSAWLVAKTAGHGNIYTCNVAQADLRTTNCNDPLTVNGPVISNMLHLRRTGGAGAGADSVRAAETFNLRPDAYLWGVQQTKATLKVPTAKVTELPPKF